MLRPSPSSDALRDAFRLEVSRTQRQSDGTISLDGVRFEIPARYRHFRKVSVRYARWDLRRVDLVDPRSGTILAPLYPLDRKANADGQRLLFEPDASGATDRRRPGVRTAERRPARGRRELPPLLKRILDEYSATGMPPAYLPKNPHPKKGEALMNAKKLLSLWGLKWNPFSPELPSEGLLVTARIENFAWRVEQLVQEGGFALISRRVGNRQVGGPADRRRTPVGAARRGGRRAGKAAVQDAPTSIANWATSSR